MTQDEQTLRYRVPHRQDPVVVMHALSSAGYPAEMESGGAASYLRIDCPRGQRDRERIRDVIAEDAGKTSLEGPHFSRRVTFDDEE